MRTTARRRPPRATAGLYWLAAGMAALALVTAGLAAGRPADAARRPALVQAAEVLDLDRAVRARAGLDARPAAGARDAPHRLGDRRGPRARDGDHRRPGGPRPEVALQHRRPPRRRALLDHGRHHHRGLARHARRRAAVPARARSRPGDDARDPARPRGVAGRDGGRVPAGRRTAATRSACPTAAPACPSSAGARRAATCGSPTSSACTPSRCCRCWPRSWRTAGASRRCARGSCGRSRSATSAVVLLLIWQALRAQPLFAPDALTLGAPRAVVRPSPRSLAVLLRRTGAGGPCVSLA